MGGPAKIRGAFFLRQNFVKILTLNVFFTHFKRFFVNFLSVFCVKFLTLNSFCVFFLT